MPEISMKITKSSNTVLSTSTEIKSNTMTELLSSLKSMKEESNQELTKIVNNYNEQNQNTKPSRKSDDESESEDESTKKKFKN